MAKWTVGNWDEGLTFSSPANVTVANGVLISTYGFCLRIGNPVRATLPRGREIVGTARSIDEQAHLCIESDGQLAAVSAGDVVNLRPSP